MHFPRWETVNHRFRCRTLSCNPYLVPFSRHWMTTMSINVGRKRGGESDTGWAMIIQRWEQVDTRSSPRIWAGRLRLLVLEHQKTEVIAKVSLASQSIYPFLHGQPATVTKDTRVYSSRNWSKSLMYITSTTIYKCLIVIAVNCKTRSIRRRRRLAFILITFLSVVPFESYLNPLRNQVRVSDDGNSSRQNTVFANLYQSFYFVIVYSTT